MELENKWVTAGTYTRSELTDLVEGRIELAQLYKHPRISRTNKLTGTTKMALSLNEPDNTDNLEEGSLSNVLLRYHVTGFEKCMCFEPVTLQYKRLRNGVFASLTLQIMNQ